MNPARAATVIDALRQKTVANGCTPGEAASAAARAMLLTVRYPQPKEIRKPEVVQPAAPKPASRPSEAEYAAWGAQFERTPYRPSAPQYAWTPLAYVVFWTIGIVLAVATIYAMMPTPDYHVRGIA
jgi:hypothetical protein